MMACPAEIQSFSICKKTPAEYIGYLQNKGFTVLSQPTYYVKKIYSRLKKISAIIDTCLSRRMENGNIHDSFRAEVYM
jgi:hypothetical protein